MCAHTLIDMYEYCYVCRFNTYSSNTHAYMYIPRARACAFIQFGVRINIYIYE